MRNAWSIWAKALGPRISQSDREADFAAAVRTAKYLIEFITCIFIVSGVIRHWNG